MKWNYRVLATEHHGQLCLHIYEVIYNEKGEPEAYTDVSVIGESLEELKGSLEKMRACLNSPVISADDFPKEIDLDSLINKNK